MVEALIALEHGGDLADLNGRLPLGIGLELKDVDGVLEAGAVAVTDKNAVAADAQSAAIACGVQVAAFPCAGGRILHRRHSQHPMQLLDVAEQVQLLLDGRATPARASSSEENGSRSPLRLTRTEGICPMGVSKVVGWQPAGSFE